MQTVTVPVKTFEKILSKLDQLSQTVENISEKLEGAPAYGSKEWWEWANTKADEDIKAGRISPVLHNKKGLQEYLDSLKAL